MNTRLRICLCILAILCVANVGWRVWANWGLITIDADSRPVAEVAHSVEKQAGIRLATNLPADAKVSVHVHKVPLLHALDVLAAATNATWSVGYFSAPDRPSIDTALANFSNNQELEGWKKVGLPQLPMRGMELDPGKFDPRLDRWEVQPASEATLQAYLEQAAHTLSVQYWMPAQWNPAVSPPPKPGKIQDVMPKLAKSVNGQTSAVFLLTSMAQFPGGFAGAGAGGGGQNQGARPSSGSASPGGAGGTSSDEMRKLMEDRIAAQINRLPPDKRAAAQEEMEKRKKFFEELAQLSPEERKAKMQQAIENFMNNPANAAKVESNGIQRGAMQSASQRNAFYRQVIGARNQ